MSSPKGNEADFESCAACGGKELTPHRQVAGQVGPEGLSPTTDRFGIALADIVRCALCDHMQLERFPSQAQLSEEYSAVASEDYLLEETGQRLTARRTLTILERHVRPGALLDLGCWVGFLLAEAEERGWRGLGVEPSEFASQFARERLGLDVRTGGILETPLPEAAFDAVLLGDVIEHLPDPGQALDRILRALKPEGVVALALPDAGSMVAKLLGSRWWSVIPTHVHYFTRHSLRILLARHGLETIEVTTAPKAFSVRYYLERTAGYSPPLARGLVGAAQRAGLAEQIWAPDFRDRMLLVARRQGPGQLRER